MLPLQISDFVVDCITGMVSTSAIQFMEAVLLNKRAAGFAAESLRQKYEKRILPASYDHVVSNLVLQRQDFIDFIKECKQISKGELERFLKQRIADRATDWTLNKPDSHLFDEIIEDFYAKYFDFFISNNQQLSLLNLTAISNDVLSRFNELKSLIEANLNGTSVRTEKEIVGQDLLVFLTSLCVAHNIVLSTPAILAILIYEPSTLFPSRNLLVYSKQELNFDELDLVVELGKRESCSSVVLATDSAPSVSLAQCADIRRVRIISMSDLKKLLLQQQGNVRFIVGSIGAQEFARRLNVHEVYISPDAVQAIPGDEMERKFLSERHSAFDLVNDFLQNEEENLLFVLGGYGSGKSALCCKLLERYSFSHSEWLPVYVSLKDISESGKLAEVVERAIHIGKAVGGINKRVLTILDGLDEIPDAMSRNGQRRNMLSVHLIASRHGKIIATARASYFRGMDDFWAFFSSGTEHELWDQVSRFIPESKQRPRIKTILLREFSSAQVEEYINLFGKIRNKGEQYPQIFFASLHKLDHAHLGKVLARNPLYLFLLASTEPWNLTQVKCFADVVGVFVDYWLARDIEKGPSRWLLTLRDRKLFIAELAWDMFCKGQYMLSHGDFDQYVRSYFMNPTEPEDSASLILDLQTTGIFHSIGETLIFSFEIFADLFVAQRFYQCHPIKVPSIDQVHLLLGMVETGQKEFVYKPETPIDMLKAEMHALALSTDAKTIHIDPEGIIYGKLPKGWAWPRSNKPINGVFRSIVHRSYELAKLDARDLRILISGRLGLHARATALLVRRLENWLTDLKWEIQPILQLEGRGYVANAGSVMQVMMLAAATGTVLALKYQNCQRKDVEIFLRTWLRARPVDHPEANWEWDCNVD